GDYRGDSRHALSPPRPGRAGSSQGCLRNARPRIALGPEKGLPDQGERRVTFALVSGRLQLDFHEQDAPQDHRTSLARKGNRDFLSMLVPLTLAWPQSRQALQALRREGLHLHGCYRFRLIALPQVPLLGHAEPCGLNTAILTREETEPCLFLCLLRPQVDS